MSRKSVLSLIILSLVVTVVSAQEAPTPTKSHAVLKRDAGDWDATVKVWLAGPKEKPQVSKATEKVRMLGGMWAVSEFKGTMFGGPFSGRSQTGYDATTKKFVGTWIDSTSPYLSKMQGTFDDKTDTLTMMMESRDGSGQKMVGKNVTKYVGKDKRVFTMYMKQGDEYAKMVEITYERRAKKKKSK